MNNIHTLIEYVVTNWPFLTEAMSEKQIQSLTQKFKDEAEDFSINISEEDIRKAIIVFDNKIKQDINIRDKDLDNYTLKQLLRVVSSKPDYEKEKTILEPTPDVVYNEDGIIIYNGDLEGKCVKYGAGEKWCITKGSFGNYRFDKYRGYPNFYLVKNTNLPDSDPLSFVAIQARNNGRYVYTNRRNNPHESPEMDFDKLLREVPYLSSIDNIKDILKNIPMSDTEMQIERRFKRGIEFKEWSNDLDFEEKKLYLSVRGPQLEGYSRDRLFDDLNTDSFIIKVLPKYDKLMGWVVQNPWVLGFDNLLKHVELFKPEYQKSLLVKVNAPGHPINVTGKNILNKEFNFDFAKALVKTGKVPTDDNYNLYVTPNDKIIVNIKYDKKLIAVDIITEEETFQNIKLSKRTQKYIFDYPDISNIPLDILANTITTYGLDNGIINKIINKARTSDNISKKTIKAGNTEVLFDTSGNKLKIYQIENNNIIPADLDSEDTIVARNKFIEEISSNEEIQNNLISSIFKLSPLFDDKDTSKILANVPKNKLMVGTEAISVYNGNLYIFTIPSAFTFKFAEYSDESKKMVPSKLFSENNREAGLAYRQFLNDYNLKLNNVNLRGMFTRTTWNTPYESKVAFAEIPDLPYAEDSTYRLTVNEGRIYLINTTNPLESLRVSEKTGKLLSAKAPRTVAPRPTPTPTQMGAGERVATPLAGIGRRGRPVGGTNRPIEGNISEDLQNTLENSNLLNSFNQLPIAIRSKFFGDSTRGNLRNDRGVSRRDNLLGNLGHVDYVRIVGPSAIYGIQLESGNVVASIVAQPGNSHWLLTQNGAFQLDSPANLVAALRQRNLTEMRNYIFNEYIERNPDGINELKKHIEEIKNN